MTDRWNDLVMYVVGLIVLVAGAVTLYTLSVWTPSQLLEQALSSQAPAPAAVEPAQSEGVLGSPPVQPEGPPEPVEAPRP